MNTPVHLVEVLGRSIQGATRPFLCLADDGELYYAKGEDAGRRSLCCEWVAGTLAQRFGLPVPPFAAACVPPELVRESLRPDIHHLGAGLVFASRRVEGAREITWSEAQACPEELKARVLFFDWWVHNEDRSMSPDGGNPNLLISPGEAGRASVWVFDFNLAFDVGFSEQDFWRHHVFAASRPWWPGDFRERMQPALEDAFLVWMRLSRRCRWSGCIREVTRRCRRNWT